MEVRYKQILSAVKDLFSFPDNSGIRIMDVSDTKDANLNFVAKVHQINHRVW